MAAPTRPLDYTRVVLLVALSAEMEDACLGALGSAGVLRIENGCVAPDLVDAVRPRLVLASAELDAVDRGALEVVCAGIARIVWLPKDASAIRIEHLVAGVAAVIFGDEAALSPERARHA